MSTVLHLGEVEPERPTVAIHMTVPDGRWQRFKYAHFDVLLSLSPVRFRQSSELYPLRRPSEFGLRRMARLQARQRELSALQEDESPAAVRRVERVLEEITGMLLDAPAHVIRSLTFSQHLEILAVFPKAVTGTMPPARSARRPSTSRRSSRSSPATTAAPGRTG